MYQRWSWLAFLHWPYPPEVVQRLLPSSLRVHEADDGGAGRGGHPPPQPPPLAGPAPGRLGRHPEVGARLAPGELGQLDHHLTARWQLYTTLGPLLARATVDHEPWPLHRAVVRELRGNLVAAAGLPAPEGAPVVHWSPGARTRISGRPATPAGSRPCGPARPPGRPGTAQGPGG